MKIVFKIGPTSNKTNCNSLSGLLYKSKNLKYFPAWQWSGEQDWNTEHQVSDSISAGSGQSSAASQDEQCWLPLQHLQSTPQSARGQDTSCCATQDTRQQWDT